jgi:diaminopimelate decarboxylase
MEQLGDSITRTDEGALEIDGVSASALAEQFGTPLFVISESQLRSNAREFVRAMTAHWPGELQPMYAIKSNYTLAVRRILFQEGYGGDCFSMGEIRASLMAGAVPETLALNGSNKTQDAIDAAVSAGIRIHMDDVDELDMIRDAVQRIGRKALIGVRVRADGLEFEGWGSEYAAGTPIRQLMAESKWGLTQEQVIDVARRAMQTPDETEFAGTHQHLGRHMGRVEMFSLAVPGYVRFIAGVSAALDGWTPTWVDFGGGLTRGRDPFARRLHAGWPDVHERRAPSVDEYAEAFSDAMLSSLSRYDLPLPRVEFELGRYLIASSVTTLASVGSVKRANGTTWVNCDSTVYQLGLDLMPFHAFAVSPAEAAPGRETEMVRLHGSSCIDDVIAEDLPLPTPRRGDLLAIHDTGAYSDSEASNANAVPRPASVLVCEGSAELVKRRETHGDVFARDLIPPRLHGPAPVAETVTDAVTA